MRQSREAGGCNRTEPSSTKSCESTPVSGRTDPSRLGHGGREPGYHIWRRRSPIASAIATYGNGARRGGRTSVSSFSKIAGNSFLMATFLTYLVLFRCFSRTNFSKIMT